MQLRSKASSVLPTSRRLCFFSPILALLLIVPAISGNVSAWSTTFSTNQMLRRAFSAVPTFCSCMTGDSASEVYLRCNFPVSSFLLIAQTASCTHGAIEFAETLRRWLEQAQPESWVTSYQNSILLNACS